MGETPQDQALARTAPVLPLRPEIVARQTHDYIWHGMTNLFAALLVTWDRACRLLQPVFLARTTSSLKEACPRGGRRS